MYMEHKSNNINTDDDYKIVLNKIEKTNNEFNELMVRYVAVNREFIRQDKY